MIILMPMGYNLLKNDFNLQTSSFKFESDDTLIVFVRHSPLLVV